MITTQTLPESIFVNARPTITTTVDTHCICGASVAGVDLAAIRVVVRTRNTGPMGRPLGHVAKAYVKVVRCPHCPR